LSPDIQALDQRYLEQCLALEEWDRAITMLESGAFEFDIEGLCKLHELYLKTGNVAQAMARARQVAEMEEPPYSRAIALYSELLHRIPDNVELMIDLGALLQSTKIPSQMERGAAYFEAALKLDPKRRHLHRRLAAYYQDSVQFEEAQEHFQELYESGDPDPETYLRYAALLKDLGNVKQAIKILRPPTGVLIPEDWRGFRDCAAMLLESGDLDEAETMLDQAQALAPDDEKVCELNLLSKRLAEAKEERFLQRMLAERASRGGAELSERLALIEHLIAMDKGDRAIIECDSLLEEHPEALVQGTAADRIAGASEDGTRISPEGLPRRSVFPPGALRRDARAVQGDGAAGARSGSGSGGRMQEDSVAGAGASGVACNSGRCLYARGQLGRAC
jgi:tetratricopeptide (TPR) repeat protein